MNGSLARHRILGQKFFSLKYRNGLFLSFALTGCRGVVWQMGEGKRMEEVSFLLPPCGFWDGTQVDSLDSKCLYLLGQLISLAIMLQCWPYLCMDTTVQKASIEHLWLGRMPSLA